MALASAGYHGADVADAFRIVLQAQGITAPLKAI
jgi:hypothetical protein